MGLTRRNGRIDEEALTNCNDYDVPGTTTRRSQAMQYGIVVTSVASDISKCEDIIGIAPQDLSKTRKSLDIVGDCDGHVSLLRMNDSYKIP